MEEFCFFDDDGRHWRLPCCVGENGIVMCGSCGLGLGAVLALINPRHLTCLMVRKQSRPGYEFSEKWAFPGGMIRQFGPDATSLEEIILDSLRRRVIAEASVNLATKIPKRIQVPLVTSYTAKGLRKHVLVVPFALSPPESESFQDHRVSTNDSSVSEVAWIDPNSNWENIAPANRVIAARSLWPFLSQNQKERMSAQNAICHGLKQCNDWAAEVCLHQTPSLSPEMSANYD